MSATNRGSKRIPNDAYDTPGWLIDAILPEVFPEFLTKPYSFIPGTLPYCILEPAAGNGAIIRGIERLNIKVPLEITTLDIEPRTSESLKQDFLTWETNKRFDIIITNPPFALTLDFAKKALTLSDKVVLLTRLNWLGSQDRAPWFRENTPSSIYITPQRPKFTFNKNGKLGSDSTEYCWIVWGETTRTKLKWLKTEK